MDIKLMDEAVASIAERFAGSSPSKGLILGSGWSDVVDGFEVIDSIGYQDIPGLGKTGVVGHVGKLSFAKHGGAETLIFQGRRHWYEGAGWTPIAIPVYALKKLGVDTVLLTNAAGGARDDMKAGDMMILDDHINNLPENPLSGDHHEVWGPRFPDQSEIYKRGLRDKLAEAASVLNLNVHHGVYIASSGPTYETPAEVQAYKRWGADAVGMSTVPEALLANAAGMNVAGLSCITNLAAGISPVSLTHEEVTETTKEAMPRMKSLVLKFWELL